MFFVRHVFYFFMVFVLGKPYNSNTPGSNEQNGYPDIGSFGSQPVVGMPMLYLNKFEFWMSTWQRLVYKYHDKTRFTICTPAYVS